MSYLKRFFKRSSAVKPMASSEISETSSVTSPRVFITSGGSSITGDKPPTSYLTTLIHLVKGYVGTGIFAMGGGFKHSGIVLGPILLVFIGLMNLNGQHMLVRASLKIADEEEDEADVRPTFAETVQYTFEGSSAPFLRKNCKTFSTITNVFVYCTEVGFCCVYFVFISKHLLEITDAYGWLSSKDPLNQHLMLAIILGPMWASVFLGNLKMLMPLSLVSNFLMWAGIVIIFYYTAEDLPKFSSRKAVSSTYSEYPLFFGTTLFAFEGVTFVECHFIYVWFLVHSDFQILPLRNEMKNPKYFSSIFGILNVTMGIILILFTTVGIMSYWKYGDNIAGSVFLNLPSTEILAIVSKALIAAAVLFTFTLHLYIPFELSYPLFYKRYGPFKYPKVVTAVFRSVPVLICYFLANVIPFLESFITLVGSLTASFLALILPPILDMVAFRETMNIFTMIKDICIMGIGIIGLILGTFFSIYEICELFQKY